MERGLTLLLHLNRKDERICRGGFGCFWLVCFSSAIYMSMLHVLYDNNNNRNE